jgi:hypothetical protein
MFLRCCSRRQKFEDTPKMQLNQNARLSITLTMNGGDSSDFSML